MDISKSVLDSYFDLLRIPSIGADPAHLRDCVQCATWWRRHFESLGFRGQLLAAEGCLGAPPVLFAERPGSEGAPTVLLYGHYDVQPPDPLEAWKTPPFEPVLAEDNRVYARGAQDDKGQTFAFVTGLADFLASRPDGAAVPTLKVVLEGQEESGSTALAALLGTKDFAARVRANVLCVCDTSAAANLRPAIVAGLRGVAHFTVRLEGPNRDLHSGEYGGIAPNPAAGLARLVASLHDDSGAIAIPGFADHVTPPTEEERAAAEAAAASEEAYAADMGCPPAGGAAGLTLTERNSFQPTIEVNGIHSGYGGPGSKTIIPASAVAKLSVRLVPDQRPREAVDRIIAHLRRHVPRGMKLTVDEVTYGAPGFRLPLASPVFRLAADVLKEMDARGPVFQWDGASIPIVSVLREASGAAPLIVGWGQSADRIHSPNESYGLDQFALARTWASRILAALA